MKLTPIPPRVLKIAIVLSIVFDLFALLVMVDTSPIMFTLFMFIGQPLFAVALVLLLAAQLIELRAKELL